MLEVDDRIQEIPNPEESRIKTGKIEFKNVCFTYDTKLKYTERRQIIDDISFTVPAGKSVGIVG